MNLYHLILPCNLKNDGSQTDRRSAMKMVSFRSFRMSPQRSTSLKRLLFGTNTNIKETIPLYTPDLSKEGEEEVLALENEFTGEFRTTPPLSPNYSSLFDGVLLQCPPSRSSLHPSGDSTDVNNVRSVVQASSSDDVSNGVVNPTPSASDRAHAIGDTWLPSFGWASTRSSSSSPPPAPSSPTESSYSLHHE